MTSVLVIGSVCIDHVYVVPRAPVQDLSTVASEYMLYGGGTAYCYAKALARLSQTDCKAPPTVSLFSIVGQDFDVRAAQDIDLAYLQVADDCATDHSTIISAPAGQYIVSYRSLLPRLDTAQLPTLVPLFNGFVVTSMTVKQVCSVLDILRGQRKVMLALNAALAENMTAWGEFASVVEYLTLSDAEWRRLDKNTRHRLRAEVPLITVTRGAKGCFAYWQGTRLRGAPFDIDIPIVDCNGAGEQFGAVVYSDLLKTKTLHRQGLAETIFRANVAASLFIRRRAAHFVSEEEILGAIEKARRRVRTS